MCIRDRPQPAQPLEPVSLLEQLALPPERLLRQVPAVLPLQLALLLLMALAPLPEPLLERETSCLLYTSRCV